ncbi:MAG TPA: OsmC family protein [Micromonosporaceae bacterium]
MPTRTSSALWEGNLRDGAGTMKLGSGAYEGAFSFLSRFENGAGTNPEELIAAAHAGCFSMALSNALGQAGYTPTSIASSATVHLDRVADGFGITRIDLDTVGSVPGIDDAKFQEVAAAAKAGCPVSKLVTGADVTLTARLA